MRMRMAVQAFYTNSSTSQFDSQFHEAAEESRTYNEAGRRVSGLALGLGRCMNRKVLSLRGSNTAAEPKPSSAFREKDP